MSPPPWSAGWGPGRQFPAGPGWPGPPGAADSLQHTGGLQFGRARRQAAQQRATAKTAIPTWNSRFRPCRSASAPATAAARRTPGVRVDHPLELENDWCRPRWNRRQHGVDDRHVEKRHERPDAGDDQGSSLVTAIRRSGSITQLTLLQAEFYNATGPGYDGACTDKLPGDQLPRSPRPSRSSVQLVDDAHHPGRLLGVARSTASRRPGISRNILTDRLDDLVDRGVLERHPYQETQSATTTPSPTRARTCRWSWRPCANGETSGQPRRRPGRALARFLRSPQRGRSTCSHCGETLLPGARKVPSRPRRQPQPRLSPSRSSRCPARHANDHRRIEGGSGAVLGGQRRDAGEAGRFCAEIDPEWTIGVKPNGGYLLSMLARAATAMQRP